MYRILLVGNNAYVKECSNELDEHSDYYLSLFDENIAAFMDNSDIIVLVNDLDDFIEKFPDYNLIEC